jgi:hypothetical protein
VNPEARRTGLVILGLALASLTMTPGMHAYDFTFG